MVPWRQSAALIMLGRNQTSGRSLFDYSMLLLKRSPKMRFAPDMSAFPGGRLDPCDLSLEWPEYLSSSTKIDRFSRQTADIYKDIDHPYPGLAFRLCAIRETFEETGLLLAKSHPSPHSQHSTVFHLPNDVLHQWRDRIRQDASQFLLMCKEIQIQPDVHSLHEWNQYLAAAIAKVRFDTIFYITTLPQTYPCLIADDDHETVSAEWLEPDTTMNRYRQNSINLLPPQIYELARLANFRKLAGLTELLSRYENNSQQRIERLLGICYKTPEAMILIMPGDDFYPSDASFTTPIISSNKTLKDFDSEKQNRLVMMNKGDDRLWQVYYRNADTKLNFNIQPLSTGWDRI